MAVLWPTETCYIPNISFLGQVSAWFLYGKGHNINLQKVVCDLIPQVSCWFLGGGGGTSKEEAQHNRKLSGPKEAFATHKFHARWFFVCQKVLLRARLSCIQTFSFFPRALSRLPLVRQGQENRVQRADK